MNERAQALAVLRQARDALADRLTERILAQKGDILEEALGLSLGGSGGIDAIYDELGLRLNHVQVMLSCLPPADEEFPAADGETDASHAESTHTAMMNTVVDYYEPQLTEMPALPPPVMQHLAIAMPLPQTATFRTFAAEIQSGDLDAAAATLADLLHLEPARARTCCEVFVGHMQTDAEFLAKAMSLRKHIASGSLNAVLMLLYECFGLQGPEAIGVLPQLKAHLLEG